jgi:hypothetical protein
MPRSEPRRPADLRGWVALAWAVAFGVLYGRMLVERRGGPIRAAVARLASRPFHAGTTTARLPPGSGAANVDALRPPETGSR